LFDGWNGDPSLCGLGDVLQTSLFCAEKNKNQENETNFFMDSTNMYSKGGNALREDPDHLEMLYEKYFQDVYQYLLFFTNSQTEAEDLTQETFIRVFKSYPLFNHRSSTKTWIISIAKRTAIDYYRKRKWISLLPETVANVMKSREGDPQQLIEVKEEWEVIQIALSRLKPDYRNVVILRGLKEYSVKETAEILDWKESKVKVDYHRAIKLLKEQLGSLSEGGSIHERKIR
jgi:RNA polymerase sigma-70 factor, ECF subfamily